MLTTSSIVLFVMTGAEKIATVQDAADMIANVIASK